MILIPIEFIHLLIKLKGALIQEGLRHLFVEILIEQTGRLVEQGGFPIRIIETIQVLFY